MWTVDAPQMSARMTYERCISTVRDSEFRTRLASIEDSIAAASDEYATAAAATLLHTITASDGVGEVTAGELSDLYDRRFARANSPGRAVYDELILAAPHARCPLCGHRLVSTLDHHLPKRRYPALAVAPLNLVPACADCNKIKLDRMPRNSEEETLHPYFDNVENDEWLRARVVETNPPAVVFYVDPPANWNTELSRRVDRHFELFHLARLYGTQAAGELQNIRQYLSRLLEDLGPTAVRQHLQEMAESCRSARVNSWQTALYDAIAASTWFVNGGFA